LLLSSWLSKLLAIVTKSEAGVQLQLLDCKLGNISSFELSWIPLIGIGFYVILVCRGSPEMATLKALMLF